ncbi:MULTISPECIES: class I SAM-dependent methyltransferase [Desulfosediminicola]|uniref:class I SAM-dependent methyltransferase n=1 Tax=Desulfosediminicola TaxID=2886823 RepID=UPI001C3E3860|nr:class I SAM-dependent methyltransferase [Desulfosediminicola ganghwensis]
MDDYLMADRLVCRLCGADEVTFFHADDTREYYRCRECKLVFVPQQFWLSAKKEKAEYDLHQNSEDDSGYRKFLSRLSGPVISRLNAGAHGLDFGCGPGSPLAKLFAEQGFSVELYDPLYRNEPSLLEKQYDFICATEVAEHFKEPGKEFQSLFGMLKHGGLLGIMTKRVLGLQAFRNWHYIRDSTHVSFFSEETFDYLANQYNAELSVEGNDVVLFNRQ